MRFAFFRASRWSLPFLLALVTALIYLPGLQGDFEFDDGVNIVENAALKMETLSRASVLAVATSGKAGPLGRAVSMLSFAANYYFTEFEPFFFKLTNLLIHILAGFGVYFFIRHLTLALDKDGGAEQKLSRANVVAITVAGIWLVHPLNVTSVLYVVQRMTSLSALFTFWALGLYVLGRRRSLEGHQRAGLLLIFVAFGPMVALAAMSKENGVLAPYLMLCVEIVVFRFASPAKAVRYLLYTLFAGIVVIPTVLAAVNFDRLASYVANGYLQREFSLAERLLTQGPVLVFYLRQLLLPNASTMGIFHDDFPISISLMQPLGTVFSIGLIAVLVVVGVCAIRRAPALAIGILWFFIGHTMESTFLALEMVHEHRNYLPIVGPIFAAGYYFWHADFVVLAKRAKCSVVVVAIAIFGAVTFVRAMEWANVVDHAAIEVHNHPNSERANFQMGRIYTMAYRFENKAEVARLAEQYFSRATVLSDVSIFPIIASIQLSYLTQTVPSPALFALAENRLRSGRPWEANMVSLNQLVNCQLRDYCNLADADMTALLFSALANPLASAKTKGTAHSLLGGYYALRIDSLDLAGPHIKAAVEAEPDRTDFRFDLLRWHAAVGDLSAATQDLEALRKLDVWGILTRRLNAESQLLDAARKTTFK